MKKQFNLIMTLFTIVGAAIGAVLGSLIFSVKDLPDVVKVGLFFAIVSFCICGMAFLCEYLFPKINGKSWKVKFLKTSLIMFPISTLVSFMLLGSLFQFIYGMLPSSFNNTVVNDYIFLTDNSGSMNDNNDPSYMRYKHLVEFVKDNKLDSSNRIMVIPFTNVISEADIIPLSNVTAEMKQKLNDLANNPPQISGGTNGYTAINEALNRYNGQGRNSVYH